MTRPNHDRANYAIGAENNGAMMLHCAPVGDADLAYLKRCLATLRPLSDSAYMLGPAAILGTLARYSYILLGDSVYWCVQWDPGLLVVRFAADGSMAWTAIRSPVPEFGGRAPMQEDLNAYDDAADNHQYSLVFIPWDAEVGTNADREYRGFAPGNEETQQKYELAMAHVDSLGAVIESKYGANIEQWGKTCMANIRDWAGEGIRLL